MPNKTIPEITILTPSKWKDGSSKLLSELLLSRGIKSACPPPGAMPAEASNLNLRIYLGDKNSFAKRAHKYKKFGIRIGYEQTNAWIYVLSDYLDAGEDVETFVKAYNDGLSDGFVGLLKQENTSELVWYWGNLIARFNRLNPFQIALPLVALFKLEESDKDLSYWERLKGLFKMIHSDSHIPI